VENNFSLVATNNFAKSMQSLLPAGPPVYTKDVLEDGKVLSGSLTSGYRTLNLHLENGNGTIYLHREIAKLFCKKPSPV
jgi:hypothetical protein